MKEMNNHRIRVKSEKDIKRLISQYGEIDVTIEETGEEVNLCNFLHLYDGQDVMVVFEHEYDYDCLAHVFSL